MIWKKLKRKLRYNRKRSLVLIFFLLLACSFGVGYAFLQTELAIDGTSKFHEASWDVHFANVVVKNGSITPTTAASITNSTTVTFAARLENPNDFYEFNVDIVNAGTINAMLDSISILPVLTSEQQNYLDYTVTYFDGAELAPHQKLYANSTETLKVHFSYKENVDTSLYPTDDQSFTVSIQLTYVQADESAIDVVHHVYTVNVCYPDYTNGDLEDTGPREPYCDPLYAEEGVDMIQLDAPIDSTIPKYTDVNDIKTFLTPFGSDENPVFLEQTLVGGIVKESRVVFILSDAFAAEHPGVTAGTYSLLGPTGTKLYDSSTRYFYYDVSHYEANRAVLENAFGSTYCSYQTGVFNQYTCDIDGDFYMYAYVNGQVVVEGYGDLGFCYVESSGISYCRGT